MKIYISNFARRVGDWISQNGDRLTKWLLILGVSILGLILLYGAIEKVQGWRYQKRIQQLEGKLSATEAKAKELQAQADAQKVEIKAKESEAKRWEDLAKASDARLRQTKQIVIPLEKQYEEARNTPVSPVDVPCDDLCAKLATLEHPCVK